MSTTIITNDNYIQNSDIIYTDKKVCYIHDGITTIRYAPFCDELVIPKSIIKICDNTITNVNCVIIVRSFEQLVQIFNPKMYVFDSSEYHTFKISKNGQTIILKINDLVCVR